MFLFLLPGNIRKMVVRKSNVGINLNNRGSL